MSQTAHNRQIQRSHVTKETMSTQ